MAIVSHLDAGYNLARWLTRDATLALDVVQDAALKALTYFASFRGGDLRAWFLRIVRNTAYDHLAAQRSDRAAGREEIALTEDGHSATLQVADPADDPESELARQEHLAIVDRLLAALPAELRECLVLRELDELSYKEIAYVVGVPVGTVMSRLWRARQSLLGRQTGSLTRGWTMDASAPAITTVALRSLLSPAGLGIPTHILPMPGKR